ncbi:hypothetical protein IC614_02935 [Allosphingosinicella flava]|uniref:Uncharacterized protein n=1 Tax=Allosphingosinicella flava TaxID=2771430 RepID=A0A7T2GKJ9_9SPHN|nr:hypothetical protein [Sphingosinicella flava]QPQ55573.1 hypothetical protein IC614_02935 [Sphingosinicella flava]
MRSRIFILSGVSAILAPREDQMRVLSLVAAAVLASACEGDTRPDQWDAYVYSDRADMTKVETIRGFKTFEHCQIAAIDRLRSMPDPDAGDYECGYKCGTVAEYGGLNVCEETRK